MFWFKKKFNIPDDISEEVITLINNTNSMDHDEKQWWFDNYLFLREDAKQRFIDILVREKNKLEQIDREYNEAVAKINSEYLLSKI